MQIPPTYTKAIKCSICHFCLVLVAAVHEPIQYFTMYVDESGVLITLSVARTQEEMYSSALLARKRFAQPSSRQLERFLFLLYMANKETRRGAEGGLK